MKCAKCNQDMICPHCTGAEGGRKSKRTITPEQQARLQAAKVARKAAGK